MGNDAASPLSPVFTFGVITVESLAGTIAGPRGKVHVDPKVMDVLACLANRAGEVVTREQLLQAVWAGRVVGDDALSRCIYQLRRHLAEVGGINARSLLQTIPKRGYRLNCPRPVPLPGADEAADSLESRFVTAPRLRGRRVFPPFGVLAALGVVVGGVVAWVTLRDAAPELPTRNQQAFDAYISGLEYFGRSDRSNALPYAEALFRDATESDPGFALAWAGLARADTDLYWHGIDRTPERLAAARKAIEHLSALSADAPEARLATANFLFKGLGRYEEALAELNTAEAEGVTDPELYFLKAMAYRRLGNWAESVAALDRAIERDSRNVIYLRQQHITFLFLRRYDEAGRMLDRILALVPDDGTAWVDRVALALCRDGDTTLARAFEINPPNQYYDEGLAYAYTRWLAAIYDRDYASALRVLDDAVAAPILDGDLRNMSVAPAALYYARTHRLAGNVDEARDAYESVLEYVDQQLATVSGDDLPTASGLYLARAEAQAGLGRNAEALESLGEARSRIAESGDTMSALATQVAGVVRVLVPAGLTEQAIRELDNYLNEPAGHWSVDGLRRDPRLAAIVDSPAFRELSDKHGHT